jgi:hypothetical protein
MGSIHVIGAAADGTVGSLWLSTLTRFKDHLLVVVVVVVIDPGGV